MRNLGEDVREKVIEITKAMMHENKNMNEGQVIVIVMKKTKVAVKKELILWGISLKSYKNEIPVARHRNFIYIVYDIVPLQIYRDPEICVFD